MRARRFKIPVLSRLTWAWCVFALLCLGAFGVSYIDGGRTRGLVAMAVEGVERMAPPDHSARTTPDARRERPERLGPALSPTLAANETTSAEDQYRDQDQDQDQDQEGDTEDALESIDAALPANDDLASEVYITVDGAPARAIGAPSRQPVVLWSPVAAPADALLRRSAYGTIPRISPDGRKPSDVYAQTFKPGENPNIALIVGGLGINRALTERAIDELPPYVTLAFAPYAKDLPFWTKRAREAGHEILLELPMENRAADESLLGPAALLTSRTDEENAQRLDWAMSRFGAYFGVTNYLGAKFSGDRERMDALLAKIDAAGLAYIDDTGVLARMRFKGKSGVVNRLVDPGYGGDATQSKRDLEALEAIAKSEGDALGKTYVHDTSLAEIVSWAKGLDARGFSLAPASAVIAMRAGDN